MTRRPGSAAGRRGLLRPGGLRRRLVIAFVLVAAVSAGVLAVEGIFERGDAVIIRTRSGMEAGRGLSAYSSADIQRIAGHKSGEIAEILGYRGRNEIIHRDDLVVTEP